MEPLILQADSEDAGKRLDAWLAEQTELTRSAAQKLAEDRPGYGGWKTSGEEHPPDGRGRPLSVLLPEPEAVDLVPQDIPLDVVYEDDDVIVVNKPKGLVVHPAPGHPDGTLVNALLYHCGQFPLRHQRRAAPRHCPPHRPGYLRPYHCGEERLCPCQAGGTASGSYTGPDIPLHRHGESPGGCRHGRRPHRPLPGGSEEDGRGGRRPACRDPLDGAGALSRRGTMWSAVWKPAAPTRSGFTWPISAIRF